jgi:carbonic anhydrase/acetyltransferase-like protein (isoleucine patch superfamily)
MTVYRLADKSPQIHQTAYVAREAVVIGSVTLAKDSSVWAFASLRGDNDPIVVGEGSNIQEGAVLHTDEGHPLTIGKFVTVGHQAMLHGCEIGDGALIGIQAVVLNGAKIGKECLVGAGSIVTQGKQFPDRSLILGSPAKAVRLLSDEDYARVRAGALSYVERSALFKSQLVEIPDGENAVQETT